MIKTYSELIKLNTFKDRYEYLKLNGVIGNETFGFSRYLNQTLYSSDEWRSFRRKILLRDNGCDLGLSGYEFGPKEIISIHHINPITKKDILNRSGEIFNPDNVISCRHSTHMAIHYGSFERIDNQIIERRKNDTCPWRH